MIYKKSKLNSEDQELFSKKFGTFFEEFRQEGSAHWLYYLLFIVRRFFITFLILFALDPLIQLSFSFIFSLSVTPTQFALYILATRTFQCKVTAIYIFLNELLTSIFYLIIGLPYLSSAQYTESYISYLCVRIILLAIALSALSSLILSGINSLERFKARCRKRQQAASVVPISGKEHNEQFELGISQAVRFEETSNPAHHDEENVNYGLRADIHEASFSPVVPYSETNNRCEVSFD